MKMPYSVDRKAEAIAAMLGGEAIREVERRTGISRPTLQAWKREAVKPALDHKKEKELGERVAIFLADALDGLAALARQAQNTEWVNRQNASDLAIFMGVLADKTIRVAAVVQNDASAA